METQLLIVITEWFFLPSTKRWLSKVVLFLFGEDESSLYEISHYVPSGHELSIQNVIPIIACNHRAVNTRQRLQCMHGDCYK